MAYKKLKLGNFFGIKAYKILLNLGYSMKEAQRLCDKGRLQGEDIVFNKNDNIFEDAYFIDYVLNPKGLKPLFEFDKFVIYDKPSGVLSHPNGRHCMYSLCDEIWSYIGKNANITHRLDRQTSGLLIVGKTKDSCVQFKTMFENQEISKTYLAFVQGKFDGEKLEQFTINSFNNFSNNLSHIQGFVIDKNIDLVNNSDDLKIRMQICKNGKRAVTIIQPLKYYEQYNSTLVKCYPLTGRQHQIRLHLISVGHKILGEPLYGLNKEDAIKILDGKINSIEMVSLTGAKRLMLHANNLKFNFDGQRYDITSQMEFGLTSNL